MSPRPPRRISHRRDERPLQCTGAAPCGLLHTDFRPRRGRGQGDGRCGRHGPGYSTNEEAEGLRGGFPEDHGPGEQTGLPGAGGGPSWLLQVGGPPRPLPGPSGIGGRVAEGRHGGRGGLHKFVGKNLTEDLVIRILEAYVPMKIQIRQEEVWASQFQRNKAQRMHRLDAGHSDYKFMCKACGTGWPEAANQCWVCPGKEFVPFQAPSATYEADGVTYNLLIVEGKPTWIQQRDRGSLGATGPGGTRAQADRNLVDGTVLGRAPPKTDTAEEISMADVVPLNRRVDIRQEILHGGGRRGVEGRERQEVKVKVQRSLQEAEAQSFQLYHPRWTRQFGRRKSP